MNPYAANSENKSTATSASSIHQPDFAQPQQGVPELQAYDSEHMGGMTVYHNIWHDPSLPIEGEPEIDPAWLNDRPGEMAPNFLDALRQGADEQSQRGTPYPRSPFTLPDTAATNRRNVHQSQLDYGLEHGAQ